MAARFDQICFCDFQLFQIFWQTALTILFKIVIFMEFFMSLKFLLKKIIFNNIYKDLWIISNSKYIIYIIINVLYV